MSTFEAVNLRSIRNSGTSAEMSGIVSILGIDVDFCVVKRIELLSFDQGVGMDCWRFIPPCDQSLVLLKDVESWSQLLLLLLAFNSISDVRSKYISVKRNE